MIENRSWDGAIIVGPAVLAPLQDVSILNSSFDAPAEGIFIEVSGDRPIVGVIGLRNVTINDCQFQNIGIIGTAESIAQFRRGMTGGNQDEPPGESSAAPSASG